MFGDRWRVLPVMLFAVLHATPAMPVPTTTPTKSAAQRLDATRARRVAEEAFLENTARKVKTYSVKGRRARRSLLGILHPGHR